jgi:hypothetical protein
MTSKEHRLVEQGRGGKGAIENCVARPLDLLPALDENGAALCERLPLLWIAGHGFETFGHRIASKMRARSILSVARA